MFQMTSNGAMRRLQTGEICPDQLHPPSTCVRLIPPSRRALSEYFPFGDYSPNQSLTPQFRERRRRRVGIARRFLFIETVDCAQKMPRIYRNRRNHLIAVIDRLNNTPIPRREISIANKGRHGRPKESSGMPRRPLRLTSLLRPVKSPISAPFTKTHCPNRNTLGRNSQIRREN